MQFHMELVILQSDFQLNRCCTQKFLTSLLKADWSFINIGVFLFKSQCVLQTALIPLLYFAPLFLTPSCLLAWLGMTSGDHEDSFCLCLESSDRSRWKQNKKPRLKRNYVALLEFMVLINSRTEPEGCRRWRVSKAQVWIHKHTHSMCTYVCTCLYVRNSV